MNLGKSPPKQLLENDCMIPIRQCQQKVVDLVFHHLGELTKRVLLLYICQVKTLHHTYSIISLSRRSCNSDANKHLPEKLQGGLGKSGGLGAEGVG